jgi:hypothetical protein
VLKAGTFNIVVVIVLGGISAFWGSIASEPMYVAWGAPLVLGGAVLYRLNRLERLVEELRAQRTETR